MLQHSTEATGIAMHSQPDKWIKSDRNPTIECPYPYGGNFFNAVGNTPGQVRKIRKKENNHCISVYVRHLPLKYL